MVLIGLFGALLWTGSSHALDIKGFPPDTVFTIATKDDKESRKDFELKLHVYYPPDHQFTDKRAAILLWFGGGWLGGDVTQFSPQADTLAKLGMVAITPDYRTGNDEGVDPRDCVRDAKTALRWVRQHAAELGIDPDRIAGGGGSAGGHLAAATATLKKYEEAGEDTSISSRPTALVLFNPVYDNSKDGYGYSRVKKYLKDFSPILNIDSSHPPTIHFWGELDDYAPNPVNKYDSLLEAVGVDSHLHVYAGQKHGFFNYGKNDNVYYNSTIALTIWFMDSLGYFDGVSKDTSDSSATAVIRKFSRPAVPAIGADYRLYDLTGKLICRGRYTGRFPSHLSRGLYCVVVRSRNFTTLIP